MKTEEIKLRQGYPRPISYGCRVRVQIFDKVQYGTVIDFKHGHYIVRIERTAEELSCPKGWLTRV